MCKKWERLGYRPDAVVLEGPLAGGHLGFKLEEIYLESNRLENLLPPVKDMSEKHGGFPVIVAGGIYTHEDIVRFLKMGADGVQMGTRFLVTQECSATDAYKQAVINAGKEDIIVSHNPGSPCGLPFMVIKESPMYQNTLLKRENPGAIRDTCCGRTGKEISISAVHDLTTVEAFAYAMASSVLPVIIRIKRNPFTQSAPMVTALTSLQRSKN